ncbi:MAG TPA: BlaI/MecI/CopY family transcriptional regulator, partial [Pirellulales bacterium]|nr:BlaI/MecI/CopY family transcriptional regulator [Pirellulales bacterium]
KELTERELEIMQVFWRNEKPLSVADVKDELARQGLVAAYTTVATLVRILADKGFLNQLNDQRPFVFQPAKSYEEVSSKLLSDLVDRVFQGSREQLLLRLVDQKRLSAKERAALERILHQQPLGKAGKHE